jgi:hypothetical protein
MAVLGKAFVPPLLTEINKAGWRRFRNEPRATQGNRGPGRAFFFFGTMWHESRLTFVQQVYVMSEARMSQKVRRNEEILTEA